VFSRKCFATPCIHEWHVSSAAVSWMCVVYSHRPCINSITVTSPISILLSTEHMQSGSSGRRQDWDQLVDDGLTDVLRAADPMTASVRPTISSSIVVNQADRLELGPYFKATLLEHAITHYALVAGWRSGALLPKFQSVTIFGQASPIRLMLYTACNYTGSSAVAEKPLDCVCRWNLEMHNPY